MLKIILILIMSLLFISPASATMNTTNKINELHKIVQNKTEVIDEIGQREKSIQRELICLSLNIYHEARGSISKDQWSVAFVTMNRLNHESWGNTVCKVIWEQNVIKGKTVGQFSWTVRNNKTLIPKEDIAWIQAQAIAVYVYDNYMDLYDLTCGSTHYYAPKKVKHPNWANNAVCGRYIGQHLYVKLTSR